LPAPAHGRLLGWPSVFYHQVLLKQVKKEAKRSIMLYNIGNLRVWVLDFGFR